MASSLDKPNLPPTSSSEKKVEKVISGNVKTRRQPLGKKFADTFLGDDLDSVRGYIIFDVLIPTIKDTISNIVSNGVEILLFGEPRRGGSHKKDGPYVSYSDYYKKDKKERRSSGMRKNERHNFREIIFESRGDAEDVRDAMIDILESDYAQVSIGDLYDLCDITGNFTDHRYGWTDLRGAEVRRAKGGGWIIDFPRVELLD